MKKLVLLAVGLITAIVPLSGCAPASEVQATLGQPFEVPIHRDAFLPRENLRLTFQQVNKDSRCPRDVQCITAGEAVFTIRFTKGSAAASVTFTGLGSDQATATFLDYSINATLLPYPEQTGGIPPEDYSVRLVITHPPAADILPEDDLATIYAGVIRRLLTRDNNVGADSLDLSNVYLSYITSDTTHITPNAEPDPHLLSATLRGKIGARLGDVSTGLHWMAGLDSLSLDGPGMTPPGGGVAVSLGNIHPGDAGTYQVYAGLYLSNVNGTGRIYVVARSDGNWQITGTTGPIWMS